MEQDDKVQRLKDIEWAFKTIEKQAVNPSNYRKSHQTRILQAISVVRSQVQVLIKDANEGQDHQEE